MRALKAILRALLASGPALVEVLRFLGRLFRPRSDRESKGARAHCVPIDHPAFRRPDPLIYDQYYLMKLGLAVTWDNPDIDLLLDGKAVPAGSLQPSTHYEVRVRVWNASFHAPVVQMPVHLSYLAFGVGTVSYPVDTKPVSVGVIGAPNQPAYVSFDWLTPDTPGHYCLQALLDPADDANGANNLGQQNTDVGVAHSPATFDFELRNDTQRPHRYRFTVDSYVIPPADPCPVDDGRLDPRAAEEQRRKRLAAHHPAAHPLPAGWQVSCAPDEPELAPGEQVTITVTATPPDGWTDEQPLNVNAIDDRGELSGGVTLIVQREH